MPMAALQALHSLSSSLRLLRTSLLHCIYRYIFCVDVWKALTKRPSAQTALCRLLTLLALLTQSPTLQLTGEVWARPNCLGLLWEMRRITRL